MNGSELLAVGKSGGPVRISVNDAAGTRVVLTDDSCTVTLTDGLAVLFKGLLGAPGPLDKAQLKARIWQTQARSNATVQNAITALRGALAPLFDNPVIACGKPARYALNLGLPPSPSSGPSPGTGARPSHWPARLIICATQALCCTVAAGLALQAVGDHQGAGIVLPTGRTAGEVFHAAIALAGQRRLRGLEEARYFIDMETLGVGPAHATSRHAFVRRSFIDRLRASGYRIEEERIAFFRGAIDHDEATHFERYVPVLRSTPLAVHVVTVSPDGHLIGYSAGRHKNLDDIVCDDCTIQTLSERDRRYIDARLPSASMLSIGLLNVLRADTLVVPVYQAAKGAILRTMLASDPDAAIPATLLKLHHRATVVTTAGIFEAVAEREDSIEIRSTRDINDKLGIFVA